ncbi:MAG: hypothetical protein JW862_08450, partial [Anaerolineales bacterium]|nr:hypothetical protein [Anaerolineales bacterium]
ALAGDLDIARVTATSAGDPAQSASLDLTTTANAVYGVGLLPGTLDTTGLPGTVVEYDLLITNQGNASDSFDLVISGESWDTAVNATVGPLAAGASTTISVSVTIPALAANGSTDNAILTANSQADGSQSVTSSLTTTARFYLLFAPIVVQ